MSVRPPVQIAKEIESMQALVRAGSLSEAAGRAAIDQLTGELLASATARATSPPSTPALADSPGTWAGRSGNGAEDELPAIDLDGGDESDDAVAGVPASATGSPPPSAAAAPSATQAAGRAGARKSVEELIRAEREQIEALRNGAAPVPAAPDRRGVGVMPPTEAPGFAPAPAAEAPPYRGATLAGRLVLVAPLVVATWFAGFILVGFVVVFLLHDEGVAAFFELGWFYASAQFGMAIVWRIARHDKFVPSARVVGWSLLIFMVMGCVGALNRLRAGIAGRATSTQGAPRSSVPSLWEPPEEDDAEPAGVMPSASPQASTRDPAKAARPRELAGLPPLPASAAPGDARGKASGKDITSKSVVDVTPFVGCYRDGDAMLNWHEHIVTMAYDGVGAVMYVQRTTATEASVRVRDANQPLIDGSATLRVAGASVAVVQGGRTLWTLPMLSSEPQGCPRWQ